MQYEHDLPDRTLVQRGEIRLVDFEPARHGESNKTRPAVIVSNNGANATAVRLARGTLTVVPVTSRVAEIFPFQVELPAVQSGLDVDSKAQAEQVRSVAFSRIGRRVGLVPIDLMMDLDAALRLHLSL